MRTGIDPSRAGRSHVSHRLSIDGHRGAGYGGFDTDRQARNARLEGVELLADGPQYVLCVLAPRLLRGGRVVAERPRELSEVLLAQCDVVTHSRRQLHLRDGAELLESVRPALGVLIGLGFHEELASVLDRIGGGGLRLRCGERPRQCDQSGKRPVDTRHGRSRASPETTNSLADSR
jgi:hypothetical protein